MNQGTHAAPGAAQRGRPGQMTTVMRAVAQATGPRILRIGLVQGGRVLEERTIKQRSSVTVGTSEKATFVIASEGAPPLLTLFERVGGDYYLNFVDGMSGRLALAGGIADVAALREQARRAGGGARVKLTEDARGKVVVGDATFLFQFVAPPPPQPRPQLPLAVLGGLASEIDWTLTMIAAFSFMLHFGIIGAVCSDWMDPIVPDDGSVVQLVELARTLPSPEVEEKTLDDAKPREHEAPAPAEPRHTAATHDGASAPRGTSGPRTSAADAKLLAARAEALEMGILVAINGSSAVQGALERSNVVPVDLTDAAKSADGAAAARNDGLHFGGSGQLVTGHTGGLGAIVGVTGTGVGGGEGIGAPAPAGPTGEAHIDRPISSDDVGAERVVAGLQGKFRRCYNQGLALDPGMKGSVTIVAKILPNGEVGSADGQSNAGLSDTVVKCITHALKDAQFRPSPSGSSLQVPTKFVTAR